jgi:alpha-L-arabinofuranosidase
MFNYLSAEMKTLQADVVDEHYYKSPDWFFQNSSRYDNYDRSGPKIFAGEYAAHSKDGKDPESRNTWYSALAEAAFMTGLERNADMVRMASYAPLLAHVDAWQWRPDLIWFDNLTSIGTPNYYVQKLFSNNKGSVTVPALSNGKVLNGADSVYASAVIDSASNELIVKIVNISNTAKSYTLDILGKKINTPVICSTMGSTEKFVYNELRAPSKVVPYDKSIIASKGKVNLTLDPMSFSVVRIALKK